MKDEKGSDIAYNLKSVGSLPIASGGFGSGLKLRHSTKRGRNHLKSAIGMTELVP